MLSFSEFLTESKKPIVSKRVHDFLTHLMGDITLGPDRKPSRTRLDEIAVLDTVKPGKKAEVTNVLAHPGVTQKGNEDEAKRYKGLMSNGEKIANDVGGNVYKHMKSGFDRHMDRVDSGEINPRRAGPAKKVHAEFRKTVGYTSGAAALLGGNTKIKKNEKEGEMSTGLSLAPHTLHGVKGHNACVKASTDCKQNCLGYTTGQNAMLSNINAKIAKHQFLAKHPDHFAHQLHSEMLAHVEKTAKENAATGSNLQAGFRMNVLQDYPIRHMMGRMIDHVHKRAKELGVDMVVRDYTKHPERLYQNRPDYHHLALSSTGAGHAESNEGHVADALHAGHTVAAVVEHHPKHGEITHFYDHKHDRYHPVVDGDKDDMIENRHKEAGFEKASDQTGRDKHGNKSGVVSGLKIKALRNKDKENAIAGPFVHNPSPDFKHPRGADSVGRKLPKGAVVTEINKSTHSFGQKL